MIYFDTAYLVKCYVKERGWENVRELARTQGRIACSVYGQMELHGAFHRHLREKSVAFDALQVVITQYERDQSRRLWTWLPMTDSIIDTVIDSFRSLPENIFLRTADALHLVTARRNGIKKIYSNDTRLLQAAPFFGLAAEDVIG